ncbi:hypothetical protein HPB47_024007 [Ixodes persulcatus]|uniref:Uncharacterized protein n=1 Tax=Ixodes persulcatus TaxID=34615 RepID=A0AC60Q7F0_IXOPE|nr:hypothetical protein HPB47_024007 [Ixodes persulcatus]
MPYSTHFVSQVAGAFIISLVLGLPAAPNISPPQGGCKASVYPPQIIQPSVAFSTSPSTMEAIPLFGWQHSPHHVQFGVKRGVPGVLQKHGRDYRHFGHDTELRVPYSTHFVSQSFETVILRGIPTAGAVTPDVEGRMRYYQQCRTARLTLNDNEAVDPTTPNLTWPEFRLSGSSPGVEHLLWTCLASAQQEVSCPSDF